MMHRDSRFRVPGIAEVWPGATPSFPLQAGTYRLIEMSRASSRVFATS